LQQRLIEGKGLRPDAGLMGPRAGSQSFKMERQPEMAAPAVSASMTSQQPVAAGYSNEGRASAIREANAAPVSSRAGLDTLPSGIVSASMGRGFDPTKLQMADGYGAATNAAGKTLFVAPSQYQAADGSVTSDWRQTQQYKDAIERNAADKLRLAEMQSRRLGTDPMAIQTARQGIASALLANKAQEATMQRNAYIQSLVTKAAAETDPMKQRAIIDTALAAQGKDSKHGKNLQVVDLGEYSVPDGIGGLKVVKRGQALYDADTRQVIPITPGQGGGGGGATQQSFASQAEAEAAQKSGRIKVGDVVIIGGKRFAVE